MIFCRAARSCTPLTFPEGWTSQAIVDRLNADQVLTGDITTVPPEGSLDAGDLQVHARRDARADDRPDAERAVARGRGDLGAARARPADRDAGRIRDACFDRGEGDGTRRRASARRVGVHQPAARRHAAAIRSDRALWALWRSGAAGRPADLPVGPREADALQHLSGRRAAAVADRQSRPRGARGGRQSVADRAISTSSPTEPAGTSLPTTLEEHNRNVARWRQIQAAQEKAQEAAPAAATPASACTPTADATTRPTGRLQSSCPPRVPSQE